MQSEKFHKIFNKIKHRSMKLRCDVDYTIYTQSFGAVHNLNKMKIGKLDYFSFKFGRKNHG